MTASNTPRTNNRTVYYHSTLSYNFLLLGPILDGLVGGYSYVSGGSSIPLAQNPR